MMRTVAVLLALLGVAACGADGEPLPVEDEPRQSSIRIGGSASIGVSGGS